MNIYENALLELSNELESCRLALRECRRAASRAEWRCAKILARAEHVIRLAETRNRGLVQRAEEAEAELAAMRRGVSVVPFPAPLREKYLTEAED